MMTKNQLRLALLRVPNVVQFCERHELGRRTVMRLRTRGASPTRRTIERMEAALKEEGLIPNGDERKKAARAGGSRSA